MNKRLVYEHIVSTLERRFTTAKWSAQQAYDAATSEESVAENKYDTFGLEASYLAHGQSQRVMECEKDFLSFSNNSVIVFTQEDAIKVGALVCLTAMDTHSETEKWFYLAPCAGGLKIETEFGQSVFLITASSPVGLALMGKMAGDEVCLKQAGQEVVYEIDKVL